MQSPLASRKKQSRSGTQPRIGRPYDNMRHRTSIAFCLLSAPAFACSISYRPSAADMVKNAEVIVRATALEYSVPPGAMRTTGVPASKVHFQVTETIRGNAGADLILPGYLSDRDDFNERPVPYDFVRPGGRSGSCFANSYRAGGQFVLALKKNPAGDLTVDWYALGPVNEQLHSDTDPWLLWVRDEVKRTATTGK